MLHRYGQQVCGPLGLRVQMQRPTREEKSANDADGLQQIKPMECQPGYQNHAASIAHQKNRAKLADFPTPNRPTTCPTRRPFITSEVAHDVRMHMTALNRRKMKMYFLALLTLVNQYSQKN